MPYDPFKHHRRSIRLKGYDYRRAGAYYITVVTRNRECILGDVVNGAMRLNELGRVVEEEWLRTAVVRPNIELDEYVVMPNHLHGIIMITGSAVGTDRAVDVGANRRFAPAPAPMQCHAPAPGTIGAIMMQFKSVVTKRINAVRDVQGAPVWQRNYHEHIIRNDRDLERIRAYIVGSPALWECDDENPQYRKKAG